MSILHPLAKHYNTPENYNKLKKLNDAHERANEKTIDIKIDKKELENTIDKAMQEIIRKLNK